jgi:hypothetical protein
MMTGSPQGFIEEHAYVPEHIPQYVSAISQAEPFLLDDFLAYATKDRLIFVGYPLTEAFDEGQMAKALEAATKRFRPREVSLIAPVIPSSIDNCVHSPSDYYYRLDLSTLSVSQKLRNMLTRASRELSLTQSRDFDQGHQMMIDDFVKVHPVNEATQFIFQRIGDYVSSSSTAWIFDARNKRGELVAFDVAEFRPKNYAIYMFNFSSDILYVPGVSDLLLSQLVKRAQEGDKRYINLGLGINAGVTFFKKKWGGVAFLPYTFWTYQAPRWENLDGLLQKL